jgi:hypothetical protein
MFLPSFQEIDTVIESHLKQIALLEAKISAERAAIARQKQLRNAHFPANRCPPEVLARIFLFCRPSSWVHSTPLLAFLRVTHMCAHWRNSAIGYPALWNLVPCQNVARTDFMLARAKSVNLVYRGFGRASTMEDRRREGRLLQDMSRVQVLELHTIPDYLHAAVKAALEGPAPVLETLDLTHVLGTRWMALTPPFNGQLPRLRSLRVQDSQFPWMTSYLSQLSSLTLVRIENKISAPDMVLNLREMQCLERLDIDKVVECDEGFERTGAGLRIVMPHLSFLRLNDEEPAVYFLLESLEAPVLTDLRITELLRSGYHAEPITQTYLVSSYLKKSIASFTSCHISQNGDSIRLLAGRLRPAQPFSTRAGVEGACFELAYNIRSAWLLGGLWTNEKYDDDWLGPLAAKSMLEVVQEMTNLALLTVCIQLCMKPAVQQIMDAELWPGFLRTLPSSVTALQIVDLAQHFDFAQAFTSTVLCTLGGMHALPEGEALPPTVPRLRRLTLVTVDIDLDAPESQLKGNSNRSLLMAFLEARAAQHTRLETLDLVNCPERQRRQLADLENRGLVGEVVWRQARPRD